MTSKRVCCNISLSNLTFCPIFRKFKCYTSCLIDSAISMTKPMDSFSHEQHMITDISIKIRLTVFIVKF